MSELLVIGAVTLVGFVLGYRLSIFPCQEGESQEDLGILREVRVESHEDAVGYPYSESE